MAASSSTTPMRDSLETRLAGLNESLARARSVLGNLPNEDDYHFYKLFSDFKQPTDAAAERIKTLLQRFGSADEWSDEPEEAAEWLVTVMDDLLEQVDKSLETADKGKAPAAGMAKGASKAAAGASVASYTVGKGLQSPVPLHIPTLRKPQELFSLAVDNSNLPFEAKGPYLSYDGGEDNAVGVHPEDWNAILSRRAEADVSTGVAGASAPVRTLESSVVQTAEQVDGKETGAGNSVAGPAKRPALTVNTDVATRGGRPVSPASLARGGSPRPASPSSRGLLALDMHAKRLGIGSAKRGRVHPLEKTLRELSYPPWQFQPPPDPLPEPEPIDARPIELIHTPEGLKEVAEKLAVEREVACDLEAHHYRSFQGFVCLVQLSTRKEDFVVDAIALREHIGPMLGPIFADSSILKVLHGADRDVLWLQRDFGIYVVNMFDTGQAARQLSLSGFGLGYLLELFCGVHSDKRYQLADWRIRPLPEEMFKYARMDTHYLLYIYDRLRGLLLDNGSKKKRKRKVGESGELSDDHDAPRKDLVRQVLDRSRDLCLALYEKELFHETSYLKLYKNHGRHMNKQQLAALAGLYAWRDRTAREQDESCGYILAKHLLLRLAEELPSDVRRLQAIVRGQSPVVTQRAADVIEVLRAAREQASGAGGAAFDPALWEGADVIPDFLTTSEDEGSSDLLEALAREGVDSDAESGGAPRAKSLKETSQAGFEGLGVGVQKRGIGQKSALGDPNKSAVGPSLAIVNEESDSEGEEPEANGGVSRGGVETKVQRAVVVKRAAGSALFGRPAKKAHVAKGNEQNLAGMQEMNGAGKGDDRCDAGSLRVQEAATSTQKSVRDPAVEEPSDRSEAPESTAANRDPASASEREGIANPTGSDSDAGAVDNGKVGIAKPSWGQRKRKGGLGAMFGSRPGREGSEETSAKAAAERVKASLALPFTPIGGTIPDRGLNSAKDAGRFAGPGTGLGQAEDGVKETAAEALGVGEGTDAAPLEDVMMLDEDAEAEQSGPEEVDRKPDPEAEKLALFGTPDLPQPISQAYRYRNRGGLAPAAREDSCCSGPAAESEKKRKASETLEEENGGTKNGAQSAGGGKSSGDKSGGRSGPSGPGASALAVGCEGLAKDGKFDFGAAAGVLGLGSFLGARVAAEARGGVRGSKQAKQTRGSKPEEQSYGARKEEPGHNFDPFASMEEEGAGIKAGKRSQAFPRSGNRMSTFRRT